MTPEAAGPLLKVSSIVLRVLVGVAVLAIGVSIAVALVKTKATPPIRPPSTASLVVATVPATSMDIPRRWSGYGTARAMNAVDLAAQVTARVIDRPAEIEAGVSVAAGDLIVQLEQTDYLSRARSAEQMVAQAAADLAALDVDEGAWREQLRLAEEQEAIERRELQQALDALERGAATGSEIDRRTKALRILEAAVSNVSQKLGRLPSERQSMQATLDRLRADADLARENLARTTIASPISGVIQSVAIEQGELLAVGSPVARVVDLSRIEVPLRVPASALGYVGIGDVVELRPDAPSSKGWSGQVVRIAPEADQTTRTLTVFVEVRQDAGRFQRASSEDPLLLPGEFVVGSIVGAPERGRVVVPRRAVQDGSIFVAEPNAQQSWTARRVPVEVLFHAAGEFPQIDPIERQWAVLVTPLPEGTPIIVTNLDDLTDGRFVEQQPRTATAEKSP